MLSFYVIPDMFAVTKVLLDRLAYRLTQFKFNQFMCDSFKCYE